MAVLWNYDDDVLAMPDDGRIVLLLGANDANDCETVVHERSLLLVLRADPPVVGVEADGRPLAVVAPGAPGE